jgi:AcrR family transcriptional regulator
MYNGVVYGRQVPTKRDLLIEAAARVLAEEGPGAVTARRMAREIGASTMAVYTHVGSMDELLTAVHTEGFVRFHRRLSAVRQTDEPLVDLRALGLAYRRFARAEPHLYQAMFGRTLADAALTHEQAEQALSTFAILRDAVARAADAGLLEGDPDESASQIWATVHGFVTLELAGLLFDARPAQAYDALLVTVIRGLAPSPAPRGGSLSFPPGQSGRHAARR